MISTRLAISLAAAVAVLGGCAALVDGRATRMEARAEAETPPVGQFVEVGGRRVHALVMGEGPDLVLIHGAGGNLRDFTMGIAQDLARDYRVTLLDRPGLGYSDPLPGDGVNVLLQADHLRAAADLLGVRNPIVLGHSYGGAVALAWALRDPSGPRGLVLVGAASMPFPGGLGAWYQVNASALGAATLSPLITAFATDAQIDGSVAAVFAPDPAPPGYAGHIGARLTIRRDTMRRNARQVMGLKPNLIAMEPNYPQLTLPVEILHGSNDTTVPPHIHAIPLSQRLPDARLTLIEGAGHMPHHIHPDLIRAAIDRLAAR
ncbi:alpha/beta fold hydrolase [Szabonella alba]|uniref:Alpha/beta hydrolase n=1 Tax=Szabonella alba TaxID=2804194 RepID=A0A8K0V7J1_9RHOB|nr:alpha/beta hydrolase [Szabonella alba]MBL4917184.1 alpha/beta hydrolase [Szabonella alba]